MILWNLKRHLSRMNKRAKPSREFVLALEQRLSAAGYLPVRSSWKTIWRTAAVSSSIVLSLGIGTATYAYTSDNVLPDHPLYPLRTKIENLEQQLTRSEASRENLRLKQLYRRLNEARLMSLHNKPLPSVQVNVLLRHLEEEVAQKNSATSTDADHDLQEVINIDAHELADLADQQQDFEAQEDRKQVSKMLVEQVDRVRRHVESLEKHRQNRMRVNVVPAESIHGEPQVDEADSEPSDLD